jgi:hypothetical protein
VGVFNYGVLWVHIELPEALLGGRKRPLQVGVYHFLYLRRKPIDQKLGPGVLFACIAPAEKVS